MGAPLRQWRGCSSGADSKWCDLCLHPLFGMALVSRLLGRVWQPLHSTISSATCSALEAADEQGCSWKFACVPPGL